MEFSGIFYNYIVNKGKARVKKWVEIYNYIVNKEKMYVKNERKSTTIPEIKKQVHQRICPPRDRDYCVLLQGEYT
jgi:hypothetical protein